MPINQQEKRRQLARIAVSQATALMSSIQGGAAVSYEYSSAGLTWDPTDFDAQPGLQHVDVATVNACLSIFTQLDTYFRTNNLDDTLLKMKQ